MHADLESSPLECAARLQLHTQACTGLHRQARTVSVAVLLREHGQPVEGALAHVLQLCLLPHSPGLALLLEVGRGRASALAWLLRKPPCRRPRACACRGLDCLHRSAEVSGRNVVAHDEAECRGRCKMQGKRRQLKCAACWLSRERGNRGFQKLYSRMHHGTHGVCATTRARQAAGRARQVHVGAVWRCMLSVHRAWRLAHSRLAMESGVSWMSGGEQHARAHCHAWQGVPFEV